MILLFSSNLLKQTKQPINFSDHLVTWQLPNNNNNNNKNQYSAFTEWALFRIWVIGLSVCWTPFFHFYLFFYEYDTNIFFFLFKKLKTILSHKLVSITFNNCTYRTTKFLLQIKWIEPHILNRVPFTHFLCLIFKKEKKKVNFFNFSSEMFKFNQRKGG